MTCSTFAALASERVVIQSPSEVVDDYGGRVTTWANVGTYWAAITPATGRELVAQGAVQNRVTHRFLIRYQSALKDVKTTGKYRISFDDRLFGIHSIRNLAADMKREGAAYQEILAEENSPDVYSAG